MTVPVSALRLFRVTLGAVVCLQSVLTVREGLAGPGHDPHRVLVGSVEAVAALLFLLPRTRAIGGWVLLAVFAVALLIHGLQHQFASSLLIDASGVWLVLRCDHGARVPADAPPAPPIA